MTDSAAAAAAAPSAVIVDIDRNSNNCWNCNIKEGLVPETKPSELSSVPNFLWDELKDALNPVLRKYNSIRLVISSTIAVIFLAYVAFMLFSTFNKSEVEKDYNEDDRAKDDVDYGMQLAKTRHIQETVSKFRPRFASNGVHIVFETSNTGLCKTENQIEVRRLVFSPATTTTTTAVPVAVATNATANTTTATTTTPAPVVADDKSPSPQFSPAPVYTTAANQGQFGTTTTTTTTSTIFDDNQPSVVDQMMADLNRPV